MMVGTLQVELLLPESFSLKDKRLVLQSLKSRLRSTLNVSVAEVDHHDKWQRSVLGFACVSAERRGVDSLFAQVLNAIEGESRVEIIGHRVEVL